jgi:uncharacterized membrane protein YeaQ/YmgE (transglycosylase-associated protein family)
MYLVSWIFIGLAAGWLVGKTLKGDAYGPLIGIVMGVGEAVAAGFIMRSAGFVGYRGIFLTTFVAMIGAVLLTLLVGFVNGRRVLARQL